MKTKIVMDFKNKRLLNNLMNIEKQIRRLEEDKKELIGELHMKEIDVKKTIAKLDNEIWNEVKYELGIDKENKNTYSTTNRPNGAREIK